MQNVNDYLVLAQRAISKYEQQQAELTAKSGGWMISPPALMLANAYATMALAAAQRDA
jgi:hypothetical protein